MNTETLELMEAQMEIINSLQNRINLLTELQNVHSEKIQLLMELIEIQSSRIESLENI